MKILDEFFVLDRSNKKHITGECKLCGKVYSDNTGSTGNFHKHLKRKHGNHYERSKCPDSVLSNTDIDDSPECLEAHVIKINEVILKELIVRCNLPPTLVEHVGFRNFLKTVAPRWKPTSSRYFTRTLLPSLMNNCQKRILSLLENVDHLSITVDVWTDRRGRSFIGVTGHFLDTNYVPQALLLDFRRLKGPHTGENIRSITREILEKLKIKKKVFRVITDNAASMIKAYKFGLAINNDNDNDAHEREHKQQQENNCDECLDNEFPVLSEWVFVNWCEGDLRENNKDEEIGMRLSCFAHTLQLTIRDGLKQNSYLSRSLLKCFQLSQRSYKATKIAELLEEIGKTINRSNLTRWNSEYMLIKSILALGKVAVDEITDLIDDDELKFDDSDFTVLQEAIDILEPFAEITLRIQSQSIVTASLVVPSVVHILDHLRSVKLQVSFLKAMCVELEESVHRRFAGIVKRLYQQTVNAEDPFSDPIYFMCAVLDPQFKFYWIAQMNYKPVVESQLKQLLVQMILNECEQGHPAALSLSHATNDVAESLTTPAMKKCKLFQYDDGSLVPADGSLSPLQEINAYINDPIRYGFSNYWKNSRLSSLQNVVRRIFSVQASSAPIERVFSQAGMIMSARRTSMHEEVFKSLVILRVNQQVAY